MIFKCNSFLVNGVVVVVGGGGIVGRWTGHLGNIRLGKKTLILDFFFRILISTYHVDLIKCPNDILFQFEIKEI